MNRNIIETMTGTVMESRTTAPSVNSFESGIRIKSAVPPQRETSGSAIFILSNRNPPRKRPAATASAKSNSAFLPRHHEKSSDMKENVPAYAQTARRITNSGARTVFGAERFQTASDIPSDLSEGVAAIMRNAAAK